MRQQHAFGNQNSESTRQGNLIIAHQVPVGLAAWGAFSMGIILPNGTYLLHVISDPFAWGWNLLGTANFPWTPMVTWLLPYTQIGLVTIGLLFALDLGYKLSVTTYGDGAAAKRGWIPMLLFLVGLHVGLMWLYLG